MKKAALFILFIAIAATSGYAQQPNMTPNMTGLPTCDTLKMLSIIAEEVGYVVTDKFGYIEEMHFKEETDYPFMVLGCGRNVSGFLETENGVFAIWCATHELRVSSVFVSNEWHDGYGNVYGETSVMPYENIRKFNVRE